MLKYAIENYGAISHEIKPLLKKHWEEVGLDREAVPLDVDEARYSHLSATGGLVIVTLRDDARLVGYIAAIVSTHLHYASTLCGFLDVFWLDPGYRAGINGIRMFTELETVLKAMGVKKMIGQTKLGDLDMSKMFEYLGWKAIEKLFSKVVT